MSGYRRPSIQSYPIVPDKWNGICRVVFVSLTPVANRIRELRELRGRDAPDAFTQAAIAIRLGVTERTVWRWEHGVSRPPMRHARALARALGVTIDDLGLESESPPGTNH